LVDELTFVTMGSKDCCFSNFTLFKTILIYNEVKDWILGHFNLIWTPRSFSNHKLRFKFLTLYKIKMTQEWINMVDNISNKVQTMSFWWAQVFRLPDAKVPSRICWETSFHSCGPRCSAMAPEAKWQF
jgi:hypothetical protein